eukprot:CAMPEP_0196601142 /NCGR_PEP_ID=MMETSP1081-20130531/95755_1 /TAXON_ID=36882 /ORGANISM="Pyramimonas amylifera, Strain CCMP720" /LENGTH=175 /DNA_ID=CAMNT_0041927009 /DNA_START=686 /DNA_END=1213 /DNA_ORIENTATION=+
MIKKVEPNTPYEVTKHVSDGIMLKGGMELKIGQLKGWMAMVEERSVAALDLLAISSGNEQEEAYDVPTSFMSWHVGNKRSRSSTGEELESRMQRLASWESRLHMKAKGVMESQQRVLEKELELKKKEEEMRKKELLLKEKASLLGRKATKTDAKTRFRNSLSSGLQRKTRKTYVL